ncbi:MAG: hypothetical protein M3436_04910 [Pseudomonadota bacterium]|nr:hypothetical protein [Pseudomonadota bacterium]
MAAEFAGHHLDICCAAALDMKSTGQKDRDINFAGNTTNVYTRLLGCFHQLTLKLSIIFIRPPFRRNPIPKLRPLE